MQRKLDWLSPISDTPDSYGNVYVNMKFDDGTQAYKGGKPDAMVKHYADLLAIKMAGDLVEIELADEGKTTAKGAKKWTLVGYPGWSAPVAQGGKAQANANGSGDREDAILRSVALKAAVKLWADTPNASVLDIADKLYSWLVRGEGQTDATGGTPERTTDPIPVPTSEGGVTKSGTDKSGSPASLAPQTTHPSDSTSAVANGEGSAAVESEGVAVSSGGPRAATPKDTENPWEGMDVALET